MLYLRRPSPKQKRPRSWLTANPLWVLPMSLGVEEPHSLKEGPVPRFQGGQDSPKEGLGLRPRIAASSPKSPEFFYSRCNYKMRPILYSNNTTLFQNSLGLRKGVEKPVLGQVFPVSLTCVRPGVQGRRITGNDPKGPARPSSCFGDLQYSAMLRLSARGIGLALL